MDSEMCELTTYEDYVVTFVYQSTSAIDFSVKIDYHYEQFCKIFSSAIKTNGELIILF